MPGHGMIESEGCILFPGTPVSEPLVLEIMAWSQLRSFGSDGATPAEFADHLFANRRARGPRPACIARVRSLLAEMTALSGERRVERLPGERYRALLAT
jgi:hypothetical protein